MIYSGADLITLKKIRDEIDMATLSYISKKNIKTGVSHRKMKVLKKIIKRVLDKHRRQGLL